MSEGKCKGSGGADMLVDTDNLKDIKGNWYLRDKGEQCAYICDGMDECGGHSVKAHRLVLALCR